MEKKLEQLLLTKKFGELTAEERYYVTESIGEEEYGRLHILLNKSKKALKNMPPLNPAIKNNLLAAMRKQHEKPLAIVRMMRYSIPAWQAAAAVALMVGLHFWLQAEPQVIGKTETVYVYSTDTIYQEVVMPSMEIPRPRLHPRINVKPDDEIHNLGNEPTIIASADTSARDYLVSPPLADSFAINVSFPRGQSASQTTDLWKLLEEVY